MTTPFESFAAFHAQVVKADEAGAPYPEQVAVPLDEPFRNVAGSIQNLFLMGEAGSVTLITSQAGAVRANHWHVTDWHYAYVLSGQVVYFHRPQGSNGPLQWSSFGAGEAFFTPPGVEHAMAFPVDTAVLTVSRRSRDHASHEEDVKRLPLIEARWEPLAASYSFEPVPGVEVEGV